MFAALAVKVPTLASLTLACPVSHGLELPTELRGFTAIIALNLGVHMAFFEISPAHTPHPMHFMAYEIKAFSCGHYSTFSLVAISV